MATEEVIAANLGRLWVHYRATPDNDLNAAVVLNDWTRVLDGFTDAQVGRACSAWLDNERWMPALSEVLTEVQQEARLDARLEAAAQALPAGPRNDEPIADAKVAVRAIRAAMALHLPPANTWAEMEQRAALDYESIVPSNVVHVRGSMDTRGHDHHNGAAGCPVCSRVAKDEWEPRERPLWSACRECDGSKFVEVSDNVVRPCSECNRSTYTLWLGGHMEPNHRCEECAPARRRRVASDD